MTPHWRIELFGGLRVLRGGRILSHFRTHKAGALLAYLAYYRQRAHPREELLEMLWPERDPAAGRCGLRTELHALRLLLEPCGTPPQSVLLADRSTIQLNPTAVTTDTAEFDAAIAAAMVAGSSADRERQLFRAITLYPGELLPGYFEDWVFLERQWLAEVAQQAQRQLTVHFQQVLDLPHPLRQLPESLTPTSLQRVAALRQQCDPSPSCPFESVAVDLQEQVQQLQRSINLIQDGLGQIQARVAQLCGSSSPLAAEGDSSRRRLQRDTPTISRHEQPR